MEILKLIKCLNDETRLRMINILKTRELCVCEIERALNLSQANASRHLLKLKNGGIVIDRKKRKWTYYSLNLKIIEKYSFLKELTKNLNEDIFKIDLKNLEKINVEKHSKLNVLFINDINSVNSQISKIFLHKYSDKFMTYDLKKKNVEIKEELREIMQNKGINLSTEIIQDMNNVFNENVSIDYIITFGDGKSDMNEYLLKLNSKILVFDISDFQMSNGYSKYEKLYKISKICDELEIKIKYFIASNKFDCKKNKK